MTIAPLAPFGNGEVRRDRGGRFLPGTAGGPGNPHAKAVNTWRSALFAAVTVADLRRVVRKLVKAALAGEPWAIREVLDRCLGRPPQADAAADATSQRCSIKLELDERQPARVPSG